MTVEVKGLNAQSPVTQSGEKASQELLLVILLLVDAMRDLEGRFVDAVRDLEERLAALEP